MKLNFHIFAIAALGKGLSGGDRIFIEFAKRFSKTSRVSVYVWEEGYQMCVRQGLSEGRNLKFDIVNVSLWCSFGFLVCYFARILVACFRALSIPLENNSSTIVYSASEFWMDSLPAFILKVRSPKVRWIAAWFQTAPNPLKGFSKGNRKQAYKLSAFYHWFMQLPIKPLIERWANFVLVNNEDERKYFPLLDKQGKAVVILGAVNIEDIRVWRNQHSTINLEKIYAAVFQGRFHPQKGVVELIDIWKLVTEQLPNAKLAMIGDGPLMNAVKDRIKELGIEDNIRLFGYLFDGDQKYKIFSQSKIVVHPSFFDSGGMASAEAMAFGIPCIGFDLSSYKSYYPKGMIKIRIGDLNGFADKILNLLDNKSEREKVGKEAQDMIQKNWSWDQRVNQLLSALNKIN